MVKVPREAWNDQEVRLPVGFPQLRKVVEDGGPAERELPDANLSFSTLRNALSVTAGSVCFSGGGACIVLNCPIPDKWEWNVGEGWVTLNLWPAWPSSSFTYKGPGVKGARGGQEVLNEGWKVEPECTRGSHYSVAGSVGAGWTCLWVCL